MTSRRARGTASARSHPALTLPASVVLVVLVVLVFPGEFGAAGETGEAEVVLGLRDAAQLALPGLDRTGPELAKWKLREEQGRLWPTLSLRGRYSYDSSDIVSGSDQTILGAGTGVQRYGGDLVLSYNLLQFLETGPRIEAARADERATILRLTQDETDRLQRTADSYLALLAEQEVLASLEDLRREHRAFVRQQESRFAADVIPMIDLVRARSQVVSVDREGLASKRKAAAAELALRKLTGLRPEQRIRLVFQSEQIDLAFIRARGLPGLLELARESNPRLRAATATVESARWQAAATRRALYYPSLLLSTSYGYGQDEIFTDPATRSSDFRYSIFLTLGLTLFDGGVRQAQVAQSDLRVESRLREASLAAEDVKTQIEDAYWSFVEREQAVELLEEQVSLAEDEMAQATVRADAGLAPAGEPLGVLTRLARLKQDLARARAEAQVKGIGLALLVGRNPFVPAVSVPGSPVAVARARATEPRVPLSAAEADRPALAAATPVTAPAPSSAPREARTLRGITVARGERSTTVGIVTDGRVTGYATLRLHTPPRFVVDLPAIDDAGTDAPVAPEAATPHLKRIRTGRFKDKVRIVLDLARDDVGVARVVERDGGLMIILTGPR